mgnify:CR=1 FL=1
MRMMPVVAVGLVTGLAVGWWLFGSHGRAVDIAPVDPAVALAESASTPAVAPTGAPQREQVTVSPAAAAAPGAVPAPAALSAPTTRAAAGSGLLLPVQGVQPSELRDTFTDARSEGRVHDAIDILAPAGTPVLAVADGHVEKLFDSEKGGLTLYQFTPDGVHCYYYAHLQRYAEGIVEGRPIRRGEVIGYVGSTGNADPSAPHLHFEVHVLGPEKQWWKGESINPYPLLKTP